MYNDKKQGVDLQEKTERSVKNGSDHQAGDNLEMDNYGQVLSIEAQKSDESLKQISFGLQSNKAANRFDKYEEDK